MRNFVAFTFLALLSNGASAGPLTWNPVPAPSFSSPSTNYFGNWNGQMRGYGAQNGYGGTSYIHTPDGTSSVQQLNEKMFYVRDGAGNTHLCMALSENQVRCN